MNSKRSIGSIILLGMLMFGGVALAQKDMGRTFARDALRAIVAQRTHIDVLQ